MSRFTTAAKVAKDKAAHPERYCDVKGCLWRTVHVDGRVTPCKKHPPKSVQVLPGFTITEV